jgi:hypothetical protein
MSKPSGPGVILANIVVASHFGQGGREIGNMMLRLKSGGSATELSVAGNYLSIAAMQHNRTSETVLPVSIAHSRKFKVSCSSGDNAPGWL